MLSNTAELSQGAQAPVVSSAARIPALDGVRGLAILGVLLVHARDLLDLTNPVERTLNWVGEAGAFGVDLFFVLSGLLITGVLLDSIGSAAYFRNFYARRFLRLFPIYYSYLLLSSTVVPIIHRVIRTSFPDFHGSWWWYLGYVSNWKPGHGSYDAGLGHFWSLAVEEQFYLLWPAVIFLLPRRRLGWFCGSLVAGALLLRTGLMFSGTWWNTIYRITPTRVDELAIGALIALAVRNEVWRRRSVRMSIPVGVIGCLGFGVSAVAAGGFSWEQKTIQTVGATCVGLLFGALVCRAATSTAGPIDTILQLPLLRAFGKYSYCMYVVHVLIFSHAVWVFVALSRKLPHTVALWLKVPWAALMIATVFAIAALSWRYFEAPILSLKDRFSK